MGIKESVDDLIPWSTNSSLICLNLGRSFGGLSKVFVALHNSSSNYLVVKQTNVDIQNTQHLDDIKVKCSVTKVEFKFRPKNNNQGKTDIAMTVKIMHLFTCRGLLLVETRWLVVSGHGR